MTSFYHTLLHYHKIYFFHFNRLSKGSDSPQKTIARSELRIEVLPMLANTLEALVGRNDTFLSSPLPLTATLNELASVVQRAGQLLRMKQGMDGALDTVDDIMHAGKRYIEY